MNASASRISRRPAQFDANLIYHLRCGGVEVEGKKVNQQHRKWEKMQKVLNLICSRPGFATGLWADLSFIIF